MYDAERNLLAMTKFPIDIDPVVSAVSLYFYRYVLQIMCICM